MARSPEFTDLPWIPPRSFSPGRPEGPPRFVTIHYTAGHEGFIAAEAGALYDQRRTDGTSAHFYIDADSVVQCVRTTDQSHTALRHGNWWGIHLELCGTAQTRAQWLDDISRRTVRNAAGIAARCMIKWGIPLLRIQGTGVRSPSAKGVCGHWDWTIGWPEDNGTHTDPGPAFPWDVLFADIGAAIEGDDMEQSEKLALYSGKTVAQFLADHQKERDWRMSAHGQPSPVPDFNPGPETRLGQLYALPDRLAAVERAIGQLAIPAPAPVDPAAVKAALLDPDVLSAIATAVADEDHRRSAE